MGVLLRQPPHESLFVKRSSLAHGEVRVCQRDPTFSRLAAEAMPTDREQKGRVPRPALTSCTGQSQEIAVPAALTHGRAPGMMGLGILQSASHTAGCGTE